MGERELVVFFCRCMGQMGLARQRWAATLEGGRGICPARLQGPQVTSAAPPCLIVLSLTVPEKIRMGGIIFHSMRVLTASCQEIRPCGGDRDLSWCLK